MEHALIMYAPPLVIILAITMLFAWGGRRQPAKTRRRSSED